MAEKQMNLQKFIVSVVIVGLVLVIGIYIADNIGTTLNDSTTQSFSVINEAGFINQTGYTLSGYTSNNFTLVSTAIMNATDNKTILAGNYTISALGVLRNATAVNWNTVKINYTYSTGYPNSNAASTSAAATVVSALGTGTSWVAILVVVGFATIILSMLSSGLGNSTRQESAVPYY